MYMEVDYSRRTYEEEYSRDIEGKSPILVLHDSISSAVFAHDVGSKGKLGDSIRCVQQDLESLGCANRDIVGKGDQEAAVQAVWEEVSKLREGKQSTVPEASPVGESPANGAAENAIFRVQGQIQTMVSDLESKLTRTITRESPLMKWLIEWSGGLITRQRETPTGLSSYGNIKGRESRAPLATFGERVFHMPLKGAKTRRKKAEIRQEYSVPGQKVSHG